MRYYAVITSDSEIRHYGVLGMKWGVRRYQNFDGSYTKKGLKRYEKSMSEYEKKKEEVKRAKQSGNKHSYKVAKQNLKTAKKQLKKDYKHLKQDKLADQGKRLYEEGKRITNNNDFLKLSQTGVVFGSRLLKMYGKDDLSKDLLIYGTATNLAIQLVSEYQNRRLRAYYGHTSDY